jgi:protocatechuate 3,4-dioxygenase beta subunit
MKRFIAAFSCLVATAFAFQNAVPQTTSGITIQGTVLLAPGGQPIRKANVQFRASRGQSNGQYSATTDPDGRFKIDDVKPGRYMVTIEHPGFVQAGRGGRSTSILLQPDQGATDLIFHMQPAAVITGKIVDLDGDPMKNVVVSARRVGSTSRGMGSRDEATNDLGEFRIADLRAGRYTITANPPHGVEASHPLEKDGPRSFTATQIMPFLAGYAPSPTQAVAEDYPLWDPHNH